MCTCGVFILEAGRTNCCFICFSFLLIFFLCIYSTILDSCSFPHCILQSLPSLSCSFSLYSRVAGCGYLSGFDHWFWKGSTWFLSGFWIRNPNLFSLYDQNICSPIRSLLPSARVSRRQFSLFSLSVSFWMSTHVTSCVLWAVHSQKGYCLPLNHFLIFHWDDIFEVV